MRNRPAGLPPPTPQHAAQSARDKAAAQAALRSAERREPAVRSLVSSVIHVAEENGFGEMFATAMRMKGRHG